MKKPPKTDFKSKNLTKQSGRAAKIHPGLVGVKLENYCDMKGFEHVKRCQSYCKSTKKQCRKLAIRGKERCRLHGGATPVDRGAGGIYSKYTVPVLDKITDDVKKTKKYNDHEELLAQSYALIAYLNQRIKSEAQLTPKEADRLLARIEKHIGLLEKVHRMLHGQRHIITYEKVGIIIQQIIKLIKGVVDDARVRREDIPAEIATRFEMVCLPEIE